MNAPSKLALLYDGIVVGYVRDAFLSQGTWTGIFECSIDSADEAANRVSDYIRFCVDWNEREQASNGSQPAPAVEEFDQYLDMTESQLWSIQGTNGEVYRISEAPNFFAGPEISWQLNDGSIIVL